MRLERWEKDLPVLLSKTPSRAVDAQTTKSLLAHLLKGQMMQRTFFFLLIPFSVLDSDFNPTGLLIKSQGISVLKMGLPDLLNVQTRSNQP